MDVALNWFVRGVVVAMAAAAGLRVIPASRPRARYAMVWAAYLLVLVLPAIPWFLAILADTPRIDLAPALPLVTVPAAWWASSTLIIGLWTLWAGIHALQFVRGAVDVQAAKRRGRECPGALLAHLQHWTRVSRTGRRPARVVLSDRVRLAGVLAWGRPEIAVTPTLLGQLNAVDLDRVLVHEWAHVQRRDDIGQLLQRVCRIVVGWHPAAWWLERQLEFEREAACDELAVSVTGSAKGYAGCLALLAALPQVSVRSVAAVAVLSPSNLHRRVARILHNSRAAVPRPWRALTVCSAALLVAFTVAIAHVEVAAFGVASAVISTAASTEGRVLAAAATTVSRSTEPAPSVTRTAQTSARVPVVIERSVVTEPERPPERTEARAIESVSTAAIMPVPVLVSDSHRDFPLSAPVVVRGSDPPSPAPDASAAEQGRPPWNRAADTGVAVGRASQDAGVATAGFFTRFGKRVAGSF